MNALAIACAAACAGGAAGQSGFRYTGFGAALELLGDVAGDGGCACAIGAPYADARGGSAGSVWIVDARDGRTLFALDGQRDFEGFGARLAAVGDLDGDGATDFAVAAPFAGDARGGRVDVVSGRLGVRIASVPAEATEFGFGRELAALGDLDGDGLCELAIASNEQPGPRTTAHVRVVSPGRGTTLHRLTLPGARPVFGEAVAHTLSSAGDRDGDGVPDLLVGTPRLAPEPVWVVSGARGTIFERLDPPPDAREFGATLAALADADCDGLPEIAIGTPCAPDPPGYTWICSSAKGRAVYRVAGGDRARLLGDVDADGVADFAVVDRQCASPEAQAFGSVSVRSGADGSELFTIDGDAAHDAGLAVAPAGDVDGDGRADVLIAFGVDPRSPGDLDGPATFVRVISGRDGAVLRELDFESARKSLGAR